MEDSCFIVELDICNVKEKSCNSRLKRYCVISAVGESSLHREWIKENTDFDLHLIVYDDSYHKFCCDTRFICSNKGYKLKLIYNYLQNNPFFIEKYDYFFMPDDDILMDSKNILELFQIMKKYHLQIAQPALSNSYYFYEHTLRDKFHVLHYTNFVEIMAPCFSREALKKVLFTFNINDSGWGTEYHWPHLINFTGIEIAVIDQVFAVHTRRIQSFSKKNMDDFNLYMEKYKLKREIFQTGCVLRPFGEIGNGNSESLIIDRKMYKCFNRLLNSLVERFTQNTCDLNRSVGLQGLAGEALFLASYSQISEKRKYLDAAFSILERSTRFFAQIKNDMSFQSGISGICWCIEYFAQHGFILDNTNEILEEVCYYINDEIRNKEIEGANPYWLIGIIRHYMARMNSMNFDVTNDLNNQEKKVLIELLYRINKWSEALFQSANLDIGFLANFILQLYQIKAVLALSEVNIALSNITRVFIQCISNKELSLLEIYILILISEDTNDVQLKNKAILHALNYASNMDNGDFPQILDLYLLHKLCLLIQEDVLKNTTFKLLNLFCDKYNKELLTIDELCKDVESFQLNQVIRMGLIIISILADENMKLDDCIL